jgi:threonine efflux protein
MIPTLTTIWFLHLAALLTPGANFLVVSQLAASDRARSAGFATLGVGLGTLLWAGAAVLGVQALFKAFPFLQLGLQISGALYLLWLASRLWRTPAPLAVQAVQAVRAVPSLSPAAAFRLGLLTNATNPKAALFYGSIFAAAFPAQPGTLLLASAVLMVVCNALLWHALLAYVFSRPRVRARYAAQQRWLNRLAGTMVGGLGLGLLLNALRDVRH